MTNSISIDNFCKFNNHLKELESLVTSQEDHLNKYFTELKNEINKAFLQQNHVINSDNDKKSELFCNWLQMTTSVNIFEQECKSNISTESNLATIGFTKQKLSELNQKNSLDTVDTLCHDINNIIQSEKIKIEKSLFKNKSIIFLNKFKSRDNILFNNNIQEMKKLFDLMNPDTTVGKLIIVNDEYFSKDDLVFLKNKENTQHKPTFQIVKCKQLKKVLINTLSSNQIEEISLDLAHLKELDLNATKLTKLDLEIFKGFKSLELVNLSNNYLKAIDEHLLNGLIDLKCFWLHNNLLQEINAKMFNGLINLFEINLRNNRLQVLDVNIFSEVINLTFIDLSQNNLQTIDGDLFKRNLKLKYINLSNNKLTEVNSNTFNNLKELEYIYLNSNNMLKSIASNIFNGLISLKLINLSHCNLETIDTNLFSGLTSLLFINLEFNQIHTIDALIFEKDLTNLKEIYFKGNPGLKKIDRKLFFDLPIAKWRLFKF